MAAYLSFLDWRSERRRDRREQIRETPCEETGETPYEETGQECVQSLQRLRWSWSCRKKSDVLKAKTRRALERLERPPQDDEDLLKHNFSFEEFRTLLCSLVTCKAPPSSNCSRIQSTEDPQFERVSWSVSLRR